MYVSLEAKMFNLQATYQKLCNSRKMELQAAQ